MTIDAIAMMLAFTATMQTAVAPAVPADDDIELMVLREVDGNHARPGDPVRLQVNRTVVVAGGTIPVGTPAWGEVVSAHSSGAAMGRGTISIRLVRMVVQGVDIALSGNIASVGQGGKSDRAVKMIFAPWYAVFSPGNTGKLKAGDIVHGHLPVGFRLPSNAIAPGR